MPSASCTRVTWRSAPPVALRGRAYGSCPSGCVGAGPPCEKRAAPAPCSLPAAHGRRRRLPRDRSPARPAARPLRRRFRPSTDLRPGASIAGLLPGAGTRCGGIRPGWLFFDRRSRHDRGGRTHPVLRAAKGDDHSASIVMAMSSGGDERPMRQGHALWRRGRARGIETGLWSIPGPRR